MDPLQDLMRPDPLKEASLFEQLAPFKPLFYLLGAIVLLPLVAMYFNMEDAVIHPVAMAIGRPARAIVSGKRISHGRHTSGNYLSLNYQYSPDYAPRPEVKVNDAAYNAIGKDTYVAIHYIPGCSSCVALDGDYGSSTEQGIEFLVILAFVVGVGVLQWMTGRKKYAALKMTRPPGPEPEGPVSQ